MSHRSQKKNLLKSLFQSRLAGTFHPQEAERRATETLRHVRDEVTVLVPARRSAVQDVRQCRHDADLVVAAAGFFEGPVTEHLGYFLWHTAPVHLGQDILDDPTRRPVALVVFSVGRGFRGTTREDLNRWVTVHPERRGKLGFHGGVHPAQHGTLAMQFRGRFFPIRFQPRTVTAPRCRNFDTPRKNMNINGKNISRSPGHS